MFSSVVQYFPPNIFGSCISFKMSTCISGSTIDVSKEHENYRVKRKHASGTSEQLLYSNPPCNENRKDIGVLWRALGTVTSDFFFSSGIRREFILSFQAIEHEDITRMRKSGGAATFFLYSSLSNIANEDLTDFFGTIFPEIADCI